jgi:hypothetical protein
MIGRQRPKRLRQFAEQYRLPGNAQTTDLTAMRRDHEPASILHELVWHKNY